MKLWILKMLCICCDYLRNWAFDRFFSANFASFGEYFWGAMHKWLKVKSRQMDGRHSKALSEEMD